MQTIVRWRNILRYIKVKQKGKFVESRNSLEIFRCKRSLSNKLGELGWCLFFGNNFIDPFYLRLLTLDSIGLNIYSEYSRRFGCFHLRLYTIVTYITLDDQPNPKLFSPIPMSFVQLLFRM